MADKYSILSVIKEDKRGGVYVAEHKHMGVRRLIKKSSGHTEDKDSLKREAAILGVLRHEFIPRVYDIEEDEEGFYLIEEYIEGKSLYDCIRERGVLDSDSALAYAGKLASIIEFLHSGNSFKVCHLDIQPKNIIISDDEIYLVDFGNSRTDRDFGDRQQFMATKGFAPPEQYKSHFGEAVENGLQADIYGLGAVLLYMLTGRYIDNAAEELTEELTEERLRREYIGNLIDREDIRQLIGDTLSVCLQYRKSDVSILKRRILDMRGSHGVRADVGEASGYTISVAGIRHGAGATYTALTLVNILCAQGISAIYEENNDSDTVRSMAREYPDIVYDRGWFICDGYRMKPRYNKSIRLETTEQVTVRDDGVLSPDAEYGQLLVIVMGADFLGRAAAMSGYRLAEPYISEYCSGGGKVYVIFDDCSEHEFRAASAHMSVSCCYIRHGESPLSRTVRDTVRLRAITDCLLGKGEKFEEGSGKKKGERAAGRRDKEHRHNIIKRG